MIGLIDIVNWLADRGLFCVFGHSWKSAEWGRYCAVCGKKRVA